MVIVRKRREKKDYKNLTLFHRKNLWDAIILFDKVMLHKVGKKDLLFLFPNYSLFAKVNAKDNDKSQ